MLRMKLSIPHSVHLSHSSNLPVVFDLRNERRYSIRDADRMFDFVVCIESKTTIR